MDKVEKRFLEVAQNKDISDEDLFEELCYLYAKSRVDMLDRKVMFENFKKTRKGNPSLTGIVWGPDTIPLSLSYIIPRSTMHHFEYYEMEKQIRSLQKTNAKCLAQEVEMEKRIRYLEQTLASFMEQTKVERLSQEAVMQSISNELDEFQEEFYDCQTEMKEQKERIGLIEDTLKKTVMEPIPFVKDKMA